MLPGHYGQFKVKYSAPVKGQTFTHKRSKVHILIVEKALRWRYLRS